MSPVDSVVAVAKSFPSSYAAVTTCVGVEKPLVEEPLVPQPAANTLVAASTEDTTGRCFHSLEQHRHGEPPGREETLGLVALTCSHATRDPARLMPAEQVRHPGNSLRRASRIELHLVDRVDRAGIRNGLSVHRDSGLPVC